MALQYLLKSRSPSTILIGGDSAGGNLTAALLGHLTHPHPASSIPRITLSEPLLGVVLISPWMGFDISRASYQENQYLDMIPAAAAQRWSNAFMGNAKPDRYNQPILAPSSWWNDIPVKDVLITGGDEEVLIDEIREFVVKFKVCESMRQPWASLPLHRADDVSAHL
jgi:acetyl esterase/lipase